MTETLATQQAEIEALTRELADARETLRAISDGEVDALVVQDGSPQKQIFTLSSADRPYRLFVDTMADGAATVSETGVVLYVNQRLTELAGLPVSRVVGALLSNLVTAPHRQALLAHDGSSAGAEPLEVELLSEGRPPIWCRVGASRLDVDGERMVCLTFADMTASRRHASALASAHDKAVQALRTRSQFVANMSHEIRTPLNGVIGMAELMLTTDLSEEQREYADGVRASGDALMAVVNQILDFSKLDSGSFELEDIPFSPLAVLEDTCSIVAATAQANHLELLSQVRGELPTLVSGDPTRLRQVLTNLLGNAVKFTAGGHVCSTVSAVSEPGGWRLTFSVQDTGPGIDPADSGRIFNSFAQADGSTTRQYGGTGLGLAISRQLVGLMGGTIGVESQLGIGSTFTFTLLTGVVPEVPPSVGQHPLPPARVLLVDDNSASRRALAAQLTAWGLTCVAVASGEDALALDHGDGLRAWDYDVMLLDSHMPGISGVDLVTALRAARVDAGGRAPNAAAPVVLMVTDQRQRAAGKLVGVDFFVSKPIRQGRLHAQLAGALGPRDATEVGHRDPAGQRSRDHSPGAEPSPALGPVPAPGPDREPAGVRQAILLVEDNRTNQLVMVRMLQHRGFEVDVAADGRAALEMHGRRIYQAILMDCHMPVLDGYQATAEIRRREADDDSHVPILAMTANTMASDRDKCLSSGMDDYLSKPFTGEALDQALHELLKPVGPGSGNVSVATP